MAIITLPIKNKNASVQIGDSAYFCKINSHTDGAPIGGFNTARYDDIYRIGTIIAIGGSTIQVDVEEAIIEPEENDYVFFSKDNKVNTGDLKGYFSEVKFVNNSNEEAELFQISMGVEQSSK
tara:strand:+ start:3337 stop:3702 length:366 start_codon:yes stop_codon:yes gene_type:complete